MLGIKKKSYYVVIVKKSDIKNFVKIDQKKVKLEDEKISYEGKTVPLKDVSIYNEGKKTYVFWDYENNSFIQLHEKPIGIDAKFLDKFLTTSKIGIVGQLMMSIKEGMKEQKTDWGLMAKPVIIFIVGAVLGFFVGGGSI